ncbi:MAG: GntR family transcriptional regulator [Thermodesulfovibrionales bacterium]|nr:GntR family transcriptional regulator [Thermodesulfovibrionales bacterium]
MELIDREDHQKLYYQLYEIFKNKIEKSEWVLGAQIPTEEELCKTFNVSRVTVRTAVMELVRQGYLKRQQGKGTFISRTSQAEGLNMQAHLRELCFEEGIPFSPQVLARTVMMPLNGLDTLLDISPEKHVIYIKRLWSVQDEPVMVQECYIPYHLCPLLLEDDIETRSLFDLFEKKYGIKITRVKNFIELTHLKTDEARLLNLPEGAPASLLTQQFYSGDTLIMYMQSVKKSDRFRIFMEFERKVA